MTEWLVWLEDVMLAKFCEIFWKMSFLVSLQIQGRVNDEVARNKQHFALNTVLKHTVLYWLLMPAPIYWIGFSSQCTEHFSQHVRSSMSVNTTRQVEENRKHAHIKVAPQCGSHPLHLTFSLWALAIVWLQPHTLVQLSGKALNGTKITHQLRSQQCQRLCAACSFLVRTDTAGEEFKAHNRHTL